MFPESTHGWDWDPMLVASGILTKNGIKHLAIGASAIHYHRLQNALGRSAPAGNPPWKLTNNFEVSIADEQVSAAQVALSESGLFEDNNGDNCDTMYEGIGPLVKMQASWSKPTVVNLILLPETAYFPLSSETHVARISAYYSLDSLNDARVAKLPFPTWHNLVLSLAYRAVALEDHMARRSLTTLQLETGQMSTWPVYVPDDWEDEVRSLAYELLRRCCQGDGGNEDHGRPTPPRALHFFEPVDDTTAGTERVDNNHDLMGQTLIPHVLSNGVEETESLTDVAYNVEEGVVEEEEEEEDTAAVAESDLNQADHDDHGRRAR